MRILLGLLLALFILALGVAAYSFHIYRAPSVAADTAVLIPQGSGTRGALRQLHREGVMPAPWKIALPLAISGKHRKLQAGEYAFTAGTTPAGIVAMMARGDVVVHRFTFPEGWTVAQLRELLAKEELLSGEMPEEIPEGSVYPDTVHYLRGEPRASVVFRMQEQMEETLDRLWSRRAGDQLTSKEEALILASIVEKETGVEEERGRIPAVFLNRLARGMKLQSDPTVIYGISRTGRLDRPLMTRDLVRDTPYNSYSRAGLPPTPICNPGAASIAAVLNPPQSDELFFVATGTGGHYFASTLRQHNANVARYRAELKAQKSRQN